MVDSQKMIEETSPDRLLRMLPVERNDPPLWQAEELRDILRHELSAPVEFELGALGVAEAGKLRATCSASGLTVRSLADLLLHPRPPVELLVLVKEYAKLVKQHPESPLPDEVAMVLYYGSIVAARLRCGKRISRLRDRALCKGLDQMVQQPWLDESVRELFREALAFFRDGRTERNENGQPEAP